MRAVYDVTIDSSVSGDAKRIISAATFKRELPAEDSIIPIVYMLLFIDGQGNMQKRLLDMHGENDTEKSREACRKYLQDFQLPSSTSPVKFQSVKSVVEFSAALTETGALWTRGWAEDGSASAREEKRFHLLTRFTPDAEGRIQSSHGPSPISNYHFENKRMHVILENGAVFVIGALVEFHTYMADKREEGCIEITDSSKFSPIFTDRLSGSLTQEKGSFGIFGTFQPIRYLRWAYGFLCTDGTVFMRVTALDDYRKTTFTPIDSKYFGNQPIATVADYVYNAYVTTHGDVYVVDKEKVAEKLPDQLNHPSAHKSLPMPMERVKAVLWPFSDFLTIFRDDGRFLRVYLDGDQTQAVDSTAYIEGLTKDTANPHGMVCKWFGAGSMMHFYLFE
jgi:hypothetical protein